MKQRLLVMNGQKLVQREEDGEWSTEKVEKAPTIKPGIYNLHLATAADRKVAHDGVILHIDKHHIYQQVGKQLVAHARTDFDRVPDSGSVARIEYEGKKARVAASTIKAGRRLTQ